MASGIGTGVLLKERYRLERTLGRGGMAAVWLGHDEVLERPVAVKVLSDTIASDPGFVARFRREARTAAGLSHPNLVGVYDFSEEGERPYLVMQFVPGEDLASRLARGEGLDCERLARELLEALAHIHDAGILHRDVKPANVILEPEGTAKLIDFGIALPRDATALTSTGLVLGTERYAAPEVMEGRPASERSDLYSCGLVLRGCAGRRSPALDSLVEWLTAADPAARPASARQALARLERADSVGVRPFTEIGGKRTNAGGEETRAFEPIQGVEPVRARTRVRGRAGSSSRGNRLGAVAALLGVLAAVIVAAVVVLGGGGEKRGGGGSSAAQAEAGEDKRAPAKEAEPSPPAEAPATVPASTGEDPELGSALNEQGYALIQAGEYEAAVPVLEEALAAFPEGTEDLDYAYALFNLGNALRLSGRAEEAIPLLERRLEIPNQTATVRRELEAARAEAG
ncbi:MAG TPA: serine/threonine-protein kinase [Solirubrobacterales bacterium]|nr:serine/threonine-protein kinase [Solirubrobacterales bacterium]